MAKHRKRCRPGEEYDPRTIPDPLPVRIREWLAKHLVCPIIGHKPVQKFTGVIPCRRHE